MLDYITFAILFHFIVLSSKQLSDEKAKEMNKKKRSNGSLTGAAAKKKTVVPPYLRQTFFKSVGRSVTDIPIKTSALAPLAKGSEELLETFILAVNDTARKNGHGEIEFTDVEDVLWLSGLIPTGKSLFDLMRRELPLEALETIFPIAKAHNVILPQFK